MRKTAAGAFAKLLLAEFGVEILSHVVAVGDLGDSSVDLVAMQIYLDGGLLYETSADNGISIRLDSVHASPFENRLDSTFTGILYTASPRKAGKN